MTTSSPINRVDVHDAITNQIIAAIDAGAGTVQMPWHRSGPGLGRPVNIASQNAYRGVNVLALWAAAHCAGFDHGLWGTYRQWQARGAQVRRGEKSSTIVFYKTLDRDDDHHGGDHDNGEGRNRRFVARASHVFNVAQVDGFTIDAPSADADPVVRMAMAETFVVATGATVQQGGERAFYSPKQDAITMPDRWRFTGTGASTATESWYATLLHELTHWSGADHRLARQFGERFGDDAYAMEEMVAEIGAAFLCADLGVTAEPRPDHAAYVEHWLRIMKADRKAVFAAASAAGRAAEYLAELAGAERRDAA